MARSLLSVLVLGLGHAAGVACVAPGGPADVVVHGVHSRAYRAEEGRALAAVKVALGELGYTLVEEEPGRVVARSSAETRFFPIVGEQSKWREARVALAQAARGRTRVDATVEVVHGPAGSATPSRREGGDDAWYEAFFERVRAALADFPDC